MARIGNLADPVIQPQSNSMLKPQQLLAAKLIVVKKVRIAPPHRALGCARIKF
jgi:hypothetical protein